ncbi:hypothetical protein [Salinibaculum rarum]|uniref:hypothetical protein n=1 Tax=Salinibaculum rarum TaxID=3058903 RepID=UPI00265ED852|nr:hypothetical protein [Salinibaculum sp. KK48]
MNSIDNHDTVRRFTINEDIIDALLIHGRASARIEFDNRTEFVELVLTDDQNAAMNAIYRDR